MIEWLGIGHLFELSRTEAIAGFFTPLVIFAVFFLVQLVLPGKRVPGYVTNPETGEPRNYRLNGILVFAIALIVWALELTGIEHLENIRFGDTPYCPHCGSTHEEGAFDHD